MKLGILQKPPTAYMLVKGSTPLAIEAVHLTSPVRLVRVSRYIPCCFAESGGDSKSKKRKRGHDPHASSCQLSLRPSNGAWHKGAASAPAGVQSAPETLDVGKLKQGQQVTIVACNCSNMAAVVSDYAIAQQLEKACQTICLLMFVCSPSTARLCPNRPMGALGCRRLILTEL